MAKGTDKLLARIGRAQGWEDGLEKARAFVGELTLEEKADMGSFESFFIAFTQLM